MPTFKNANLTKDEQEFIKKYRSLEDLEREKGIKFFECIGDEPITADIVNDIRQKRFDYIVSNSKFQFKR